MSKLQANRIWVGAGSALALVIAIASLVLFEFDGSHQTAVRKPAERALVAANYASLPLAFEPNQGQTDPQVKYMARGDGYTLFLTRDEAVFSLSLRQPLRSQSGAAASTEPRTARSRNSGVAQAETTAVVRMKLVGAEFPTEISGSDRLAGNSNYFIGNDPAKWHSGLPNYARVSYRDVYPGVNLAFHGAQRQTEFDFLVAAGADPTPIAFSFAGAQSVTDNRAGDLVVASAAGNVVLHKPVAYQEINGSRQTVDAKFARLAGNAIGFTLGNYDHSRELVIDPAFGFSTYLGGSGNDAGQGIAVDSGGNIYVTGSTSSYTGTGSTPFPTTAGVFQGTCGCSASGGSNVFVSKISPDGSTLIYSTYVGGSGKDSCNALAVDAGGHAFVAGGTTSNNFPTTSNAYQRHSHSGAGNAFVFELASDGSGLIYNTYLGGSGSDTALGIALPTGTLAGDMIVAGKTSSSDFPTVNPLQSSFTGTTAGFVTQMNTSGSLEFSSFLGGSAIGDSANSVAVDGANNVYIAGQTYSTTFPTTSAYQSSCGGCPANSNAFVTSLALNSGSPAYNYSTYLGGAGSDAANGIAVDGAGNAYVTGTTESSQFPLTSTGFQQVYQGNTDAFVSKFNPAGSLTYSTYLGGSDFDAGASIVMDRSGNAYITGQTASPGSGTVNFPTANPTQSSFGGGDTDAFVTEINSSGTQLVFSTYLGGAGDEDVGGNYGAIAVNSTGTNIYVTGNTNPVLVTTNNFYTTSGAFQTIPQGGMDAFVTTYSQPTTPSFTLAATTPAAVSPGNSATSVVTLTANNGYASAVNLSCTVTAATGGAPLPGCGFSSSPVTPTQAGTTSTLTLTTTAATSGTPQVRRHLAGVWLGVAGFMFAGLMFSGSPGQRRKILCCLLIGVIAGSFTLMAACGGGNSSGGGGGGGGSCVAPPGAPTNLAGSQTSASGTTLNWTAPTGLGANCSLSGYTVYEGTTAIGTSNTTNFNVTGLNASTPYTFTVAASDAAGLGAQSSPASVTTGAAGTPAGTYTVTITATGTDLNTVTQTMQITLTVN